MRLSLYKSLESVEVLKGIIAGSVVLKNYTSYFSVIFYPNYKHSSNIPHTNNNVTFLIFENNIFQNLFVTPYFQCMYLIITK